MDDTTYRQAAQAASNTIQRAARSRTLTAKLPPLDAQTRRAATLYAKAASLGEGSGASPYPLARAFAALELAARKAASIGLTACSEALQRLATDASGSVGEPANPASCGSANVPVGGGCVPRNAL